MPTLERDGVRLHYEVTGDGYPLLLFAPGGMHSIASMWRERPGAPGEPMPWIDPPNELSADFRVIAMDQRNAGQSSAPVRDTDGWPVYAQDHIALLDHLGIERAHLMGGCIGSSYALGLCRAAPDRVGAVVLQNPIGLSADNRPAFLQMFDAWARPLGGGFVTFRDNMFGGDFVFSVGREFVASCPVPFLVLAGNDTFHPRAVADEIAALAPDAELVLEWTSPTHHDQTLAHIRDFLLSRTP
jgi:pimeloyl-ACP methyl ester carboxylesterase